ncbi:tegument protein UL51 [Macacine alphaherpesvirus 1]|uniref:Tegument protein UL51 n=1 Tax=Macacine alphaherpesvirus 2 TaxID=2845554 RepID=A0A1X9WF49_9ALPH|nr:tegument protein UL51 [Macacine alphaherpesvirus 1]ARS01689.1 tegument protein UL51 [Macacine alphaherpesvirus 2]
MAGLLGALCGWGPHPREQYEMVRVAVPPSEAEPRLREALTVVNALLPAPITLDDALESLDETRRLVKARALARTYHACTVNLDRLSRHQLGADTASLDGAVEAHRAKMRRLADTCLATILQMYMSVGAADRSADVLVAQAIRSMAESDVVMEDVAIAERALGLSGETTATTRPAALAAPQIAATTTAAAPTPSPVVPAIPPPPAAESAPRPAAAQERPKTPSTDRLLVLA